MFAETPLAMSIMNAFTGELRQEVHKLNHDVRIDEAGGIRRGCSIVVGDGTDQWRVGDFEFTHSHDISGSGGITFATLEIFTGGQGWLGLTSLYIDNQLVGTLTDGDTSTGLTGGQNIARLDTFDMMPFSSFLDGADEIKVDTFYSGDIDNDGDIDEDGWVLDYSRLTITYENANPNVTTPVPEPGGLAFVGELK